MVSLEMNWVCRDFGLGDVVGGLVADDCGGGDALTAVAEKKTFDDLTGA